jgi:hypothetical protein
MVEEAGHAIYRDKPEAVLKALRDMMPAADRRR